jgi:hypothetical protein
VSWFAALVATMVVVAVAAPSEAQAFAWKDVCEATVYNHTGSVNGVTPASAVLAELPPNPLDLGVWSAAYALVHLGAGAGLPKDGATFTTIGLPVTWGCQIKPIFRWAGRDVACTIAAPSSGRNTFTCGNQGNALVVKITTDNDDIKGTIDFGPPPPPPIGAAVGTSGLRASAAAVPRQPKRVRALLRRGDLPGRGWRVADKAAEFGRLGQIFAANDAPASCKDDKTSEPLAKRGGASAFARRSNIIGYEHGVYASRRQSRHRLGAAVSAHSIRCLARLLTSAQFHTQARFGRYSLPGLKGVSLWRVVVRTRAGDRVTRTDFVDVAGLLHGRSNGLVLFAKPNKPASRAVERSVIRAVAHRLP